MAASTSESFAHRVQPELRAGGYSRRDGTLDFYGRINALIGPDSVVLDFGAGRGAQISASRVRGVAGPMDFQGRVARFVGCDVDPAVLDNPGLDEAVVITRGKPLPFSDATFDLVFADWVLEHIEHPDGFADEIGRILRPGGWFCARTPSALSYIALAARLVPERLHGHVLGAVQAGREDRDVFPKFYRINSPGAIRRAFPESAFFNASYTHNPEPGYHGNRLWLYRLIDLYQAMPFAATRTTQHIFVQKK